jgi:hypothetical protein
MHAERTRNKCAGIERGYTSRSLQHPASGSDDSDDQAAANVKVNVAPSPGVLSTQMR